ncbi:glycine cleavage system aminomethyltransferase GcvT [Candidatus Pelagibacter bacterium nBUS_44]|uniref:glycine cleavage system aminomethyltransferase GcvT n=1 Tax=Candidatus Pelagibacter bacterium nBUS_44 TaxID=3374195 RepID=UPI003EC01A84
MEIKKTSLNKLHQENKAKFVEFAGYQMPIQYSKGIVEEHKFTRSHSGIFDVSHMGQLFIYGDDELTEDLEKIFPLNLKNLETNSSKYSFLMNNEAGIYDDLIITKIDTGFLIILNAACKDNDFKIISKLLNNRYEMNLDENRSLIAIQGPRSVNILDAILNGINKLSFMSGNWFIYKEQKLFVTRSGYTGEDGFEISIPNDLAEDFTKKLIENGAQLIGLGARDTLRLEAGLCLYGHELGEDITPIEANLAWAISKERMENGGFIGSDKIINQLNDGAKQIRVGIKPEGRLIAREKTKIFNTDELIIGEVTSGTFGPSVSGPVAMGYVKKEFSKKDTKVFLEVRGKKHPANICGLPFYKKSYVKGATK